ncbi:tetratricopeptide repeat protein [Prosthecobacter fluviatilis]|uniref:Tetratricopeptide repeat-containing protein n=1 Tax=Prosthecobacter fluviatilis TaxID=445931 RepID=A0ABW0KKC6_9BACT
MKKFILFLALGLVCFGQTPQQAAEVGKYHQMLLRHPRAGLVFDRFYSAWMETGTPDSLAEFLSAKTATAADLLVLAIFHEQRGNEAEALKAYTSALDREGTNPLAWLQRAKLEARMMSFSAALKSLAEAEKAGADAELARELGQLRGRWLLRTGKPDAALQAWQDLLKAHADDEDLTEEVIELQLDEGLFAEAEAQMLALIAKTKDPYARAVRQLRLSEIQLRASRKDAALALLTATLAGTGQGTWIEGEVLAQIEAMFRRDENLSGLVKELEKLQAAHPQRTALDQQRARLLAELGEKDKALAIYAALLQKTPGQRALRETYLDLLARFEQHKEAILQTNILLEQSPDDRELLIRLATLQERAKDRAAVSATLEKFLAAKDTSEFDHLRVARLYESWERNEDATQAYARMVAAFPESSSAREAQAHYLHRIGKRDEALAIWRDLAKKGTLAQLMAVGQALMARLEPQVALEVLQARQPEFPGDERLLGLLINAALGSKKASDAIPWAVARVRATANVAFMDDALRQAVACLKADEPRLDETLAALKRNAPSIQERILLATLLEEKKDSLGAENTLRQIPPEHALAAQTRLLSLMESRQDWLRALQEAEKLIAMPQGKNSTNAQRLVELAERAGKLDQALKWVSEWKSLSPGSPSPWLREARLLQLGGKGREALNMLQTAAHKFEDDESVAEALASGYIQQGQMGDAERIYFSLFEKEEKTEDKLRWVAPLARLASDRGQSKALTDKFIERQRTNSADAAPWLALAEIYRVTGSTTEQERSLREAMRLRPDDVNLAIQIARMDLDLGQWKRALEGLQRVAARSKGGRVQQMIASIEIEYGDANTGYRMLYELAGGAEISADDAITLAKSMTAQQDWRRVISFLEPLLQRFPEDYRLAYLQAVAFEEADRADAAMSIFIRLMGHSLELPSVKALVTPSVVRPGYLEELEKRTPRGYVDLLRLTDGRSYQAYNYRPSSIRFSGQSPSKAVMLPSSLDMLHPMCVAHAVTLMKGESAQKKEAWIAEAKNARVPGAPYLDLLEVDRYNRLIISPPELESHADDDVLLAFSISNSENVTFNVASRAFERFKSKYPELMVQAARHAVMADSKAGAPLLGEALEALEKMPPEMLRKTNVPTYYLGTLIGGGQRMREDSYAPGLPEPLCRRILSLLLRQLDATGPDAAATAYLSGVPSVANACRSLKAWKEFVALMEREVKIWTEHEPSRQSWARFPSSVSRSSQSSNGGLLAPLSFPAGSVVPGTLSLYFGRKDIYNPRNDDKLEPEEEQYAGVKPFLDSIQSASLRILLAYKMGDRERVEREITQLLDSPAPTVDDLLLAASWYSISFKHERVAELLVRASGMSISPAIRPAYDAALAQVALKLKPQAGSPLLEPAQMALRRLRSARVTSEQKDELVAAMKTLQMPDEAEQWARMAVVVPSVPQRSASYAGSSNSIDTKKLQTLLGGKDEEAIVKEAVTQLRHALAYAGNGNQSYAASRAKEIMRLVGRPGLSEKIQAAFDLGESATVAKRFELAQFFELVGQKPQAITVLEKVVEMNPKHFEARLRLCALIAATDAPSAVKMMQDVPPSAYRQNNIGSQIAELLRRDDQMPFEARMSIFTALAGMLDSSPPAADAKGLEWMIDLPYMIANQTYRESPMLAYLYLRPALVQRDGVDFHLPPTAPAAQKRREVHDHLCKAMMKHPVLAEEGFRRFAALAIQDGNKLNELADAARQILEAAKAASRSQLGGAKRRFYSSQEVTSLWSPSPAEFLIWKAWKENQMEVIAQEILPLAASALDSSQQRILRAQLAVWSCSPEAFVNNARTYLAAMSGRSTSSYAADQNLVWLMDRWQERGIGGAPLDELLATSMKQNNGFGEGYAVTHYIAVRQQMRPESGMTPFLTRLVSATLGADSSAWSKAMNSMVSVYYGGGGGSISNPPAYSMLRVISNAIRRPATFGTGLQMASLVGIADNPTWSRNSASSMVAVLKSPDHAFSALGALGWLDSAEQMLLPEDPDCMQVEFIKKVRENRETMQDLRSKLAAVKQRTFGVELCESLLQDAPSGPLSALLKRRAADVAKIPAKSGPAIMALIKLQIPALNQPAGADPALVKVLDPLLSLERKQALDEVDRWIAAARIEEVHSDARSFSDKLQAMLKSLVPGDLDRAQKLFLHACELMEARSRDASWSNYMGDNGWFRRSEILDAFKKDWPRPETMAFVMRLLHEDATGNLSPDGWAANSGYGQALIEIWRNNGGGAAMGRGLDAMLKRTAEVMQDTPHTLLPLAFFDFYLRLPQSLRVPAMQYAARMPASHPQAALGRELDFAGRFFLATDSQARQNAAAQKAVEELGGMQPVWRHCRAMLSADKANARVRQALVHFLSYWARDSIDPECARLGAAAALVSMKQKHCIHGYQYGWIIRAFNQLPVDAAWQAAAQEHWDAWLARLADGGLCSYQPCDWAINSMLRMTARSGKDDWMRAMLRTHHHTLSNEQSGIVSLMLGGRPQLAAEHFRAEWRSFLMDPQKELLWSREIVENLPAFKAACGDPGLALLGEIYLSYIKDPAKPEQAAIPGFKNREERFKDLARRFKETKFTDEEMRKDCVEIICQFYDAADLIHEAADQVAAKTNIEALAAIDQTWEHWRQLKPLQFSLGWKAAHGDVQPNIAAYDRALAARYSQSYYQRSAVKETGWGPTWVANWLWSRESEAGREPDVRAVLPFLDHVITKTPADLRDLHVADCVTQKWLIHLVVNEPEAFESWRKGLKEEDRRDLKKRVQERWEIWDYIRQLSGTQKKMRLTPEQRARLVVAVLGDEWSAAKYPAAGPGIPNLVNEIVQKGGVFKPDEFAPLAAQIAAALPRMGRTAGEAAELLAANGKSEAAAPLFALAFEHARKENEKDYGLAAGYLVKQAEILERTGKNAEALQRLKSLDEKRLGGGVKKTVESALSRLSK